MSLSAWSPCGQALSRRCRRHTGHPLPPSTCGSASISASGDGGPFATVAESALGTERLLSARRRRRAAHRVHAGGTARDTEVQKVAMATGMATAVGQSHNRSEGHSGLLPAAAAAADAATSARSITATKWIDVTSPRKAIMPP
ncbi:hypothetical protein TW95_gp1647 [Pandoravirus inopinatum]|uniref:Uncharacterized protein n=1 Tax=Pandoravirus inopinatum TaxID=1605721 RepID=A0A0B5JBI6_9VIRU|nr:hypothetical protein TW95_gp1647 [Pandoravirus inopinatum]AJF98381.1 hypothetical protein [Pandoravirus inopinatum]